MKSEKVINLCFTVLFFVVIGIGCVIAFFFPHDVNSSENRSANKVAELSIHNFLNSDFQNSIDEALGDQLPFSEKIKYCYNKVNSKLIEQIVIPLSQKYNNKYFSYFSLYLYKGKNIVYEPLKLESYKENFDLTSDVINKMIYSDKNIDFYTFYIENDSHINFETNEKTDFADYILNNINLPDNRKDVFEINDFSTFANYFYQSDHHWNYKGSYAGYLALADLLNIPKKRILHPIETKNYDCSFFGSKTRKVGSYTLRDHFSAYLFSFPEMEIFINGKKADDYGTWNEIKNSSETSVSYASFYGYDEGEIIFHNKTGNGKNLLIMGDSYDNAVLKLLASEYSNTYSVDTRHYKTEMGKKFDFNNYISENNIDTVLLIGTIGFFKSMLLAE